jgi:hypothetical protein
MKCTLCQKEITENEMTISGQHYRCHYNHQALMMSGPIK